MARVGSEQRVPPPELDPWAAYDAWERRLAVGAADPQPGVSPQPPSIDQPTQGLVTFDVANLGRAYTRVRR